MQTITKRDVCEKIARKTNNTHTTVKETVQMFLDEVISELSQGHRIELRDFGVFEIRQRAARKATLEQQAADLSSYLKNRARD